MKSDKIIYNPLGFWSNSLRSADSISGLNWKRNTSSRYSVQNLASIKNYILAFLQKNNIGAGDRGLGDCVPTQQCRLIYHGAIKIECW